MVTYKDYPSNCDSPPRSLPWISELLFLLACFRVQTRPTIPLISSTKRRDFTTTNLLPNEGNRFQFSTAIATSLATKTLNTTSSSSVLRVNM